MVPSEVITIEKFHQDFPVDKFQQLLFTARMGETIIGSGLLGSWHKEIPHVWGFAVGESYRRQGVGKEIMTQMLISAAGSDKLGVTLHVFKTNVAALALYRGCGFIIAQEAAVDQWLMIHPLSQITAAR